MQAINFSKLPIQEQTQKALSAHHTDAINQLKEKLKRSIQRASGFLLKQQINGDHWAGTLSSSALATSISIVALKLVDEEKYSSQIISGREWLHRTQNLDGGWGDATIDPSNINATSLTIGALTFTNSPQPESWVKTTLEDAGVVLRELGGWEAVGDPKRCTLSGPCRTVAALAGIMRWSEIKKLRPEVILIPPALRKTISTTFPAYLSISTLHCKMAPSLPDNLPTYKVAQKTAINWLAKIQGPNGSFEESAFLSSVIISCLTAAGLKDLGWLKDAVEFVHKSQRNDGSWPIDRDLETFDTDLVTFALTSSRTSIPNQEKVKSWLLSQQYNEPCFPTSAPPGGWAWAMPAGWPDCDDTAYTILALIKLGIEASNPAIQHGADWLEHMQNWNGSWPTFVRNSNMPFDHDCPYVTGHTLCALQAAGRLESKPEILDKALTYLLKAQRFDGSFASIWFRELTAGTASVLIALSDCGLLNTRMAEKAGEALLRNQNADGGWSGLRMQESTAEETSWALLALTHIPSNTQIIDAVRDGASWLIDHQQDDGTWKEAPIGLYYSAMWYSNSYFANTLPLQALGRVREYV